MCAKVSNEMKENESAGNRLSNFELLRILAMVMIVAHHFSVHGGFDFSTDTISVNRLWIQFIQIGGKIGVNVFVLISGYFLVSAKLPKISKTLKLWLQVFTYSIVLFAVFTLAGIQPFGIKAFIQHIFPILYGQWWFASSYFILYLAAPYLNILLNALTRSSYTKMLILFGVCWCILPTVTGCTLESNNLLWFIFLYALAGYLRIYGMPGKLGSAACIGLSFLVTLLTFGTAVVFDYLGLQNSFWLSHATFFYDMQSLPIVLISVLLLIGFSKIHIQYNRIINVISSATFGVYLIHDNRYVRGYLWSEIFHTTAYSDSHVLIPYSLLVIAVVFLGCTVIELLRIYLLEKKYLPALESLSEKFHTRKDNHQ